jgi:hypothetical protein
VHGVIVNVLAVGECGPTRRENPDACFQRGTAVVFVGAQIVATASFAGATPLETGCPSSEQVLVVADLLAMGYRVPAVVDGVDTGGNGDGIICGKPLPVVQEMQCPASECPVPVVYYFRDNNITR